VHHVFQYGDSMQYHHRTYSGIRFKVNKKCTHSWVDLSNVINTCVIAFTMLAMPRQVVTFFTLNCLGRLSNIYRGVVHERFRISNEIGGMSVRLMMAGASFLGLADVKGKGISKDRLASSLGTCIRASGLKDELDDKEIANFVDFCWKAIRHPNSFSKTLKLGAAISNMVQRRKKEGGSTQVKREVLDMDGFSDACSSAERISTDDLFRLFDTTRPIRPFEWLFTPGYIHKARNAKRPVQIEVEEVESEKPEDMDADDQNLDFDPLVLLKTEDVSTVPEEKLAERLGDLTLEEERCLNKWVQRKVILLLQSTKGLESRQKRLIDSLNDHALENKVNLAAQIREEAALVERRVLERLEQVRQQERSEFMMLARDAIEEMKAVRATSDIVRSQHDVMRAQLLEISAGKQGMDSGSGTFTHMQSPGHRAAHSGNTAQDQLETASTAAETLSTARSTKESDTTHEGVLKTAEELTRLIAEIREEHATFRTELAELKAFRPDAVSWVNKRRTAGTTPEAQNVSCAGVSSFSMSPAREDLPVSTHGTAEQHVKHEGTGWGSVVSPSTLHKPTEQQDKITCGNDPPNTSQRLGHDAQDEMLQI